MFNYNHTFSSSGLQSDAVNEQTTLQIFMFQLCALCSEKDNFFSTAPRNISDLKKNYRRYNFQAFANISGSFPEISENLRKY